MATSTKLQKAALVLENLPEAHSRKIRSRLASDDLCSVFSAINELDRSSVQPFFEALAELARETQRETRLQQQPGKQLEENPQPVQASSDLPHDHRAHEHRAIAGTPEELSGADKNPFGFLFTRSAREITSLIADEHPRDIAVVMSYLPRETSAQLLRGLEPVQRISVVRRMCDLTVGADENLSALILALKHRLMKRDQSRRADQKRKDHIAGIMKLVGPDITRQLAEQLQGELPLFDEITRNSTSAPATERRTLDRRQNPVANQADV